MTNERIIPFYYNLGTIYTVLAIIGIGYDHILLPEPL